MSDNVGFPAIANKDARILILGSMPGVKSLESKQYYAHSRNAFWPIICRLFRVRPDISYAEKKQLLKSNHIALWDVLKSCYRQGSLDASIDQSSIVINDFITFLDSHHEIEHILFNGSEAERLFTRHVLPVMTGKTPGFHKLPSTSPAHAAMNIEDKYKAWEIILRIKCQSGK